MTPKPTQLQSQLVDFVQSQPVDFVQRQLWGAEREVPSEPTLQSRIRAVNLGRFTCHVMNGSLSKILKWYTFGEGGHLGEGDVEVEAEGQEHPRYQHRHNLLLEFRVSCQHCQQRISILSVFSASCQQSCQHCQHLVSIVIILSALSAEVEAEGQEHPRYQHRHDLFDFGI